MHMKKNIILTSLFICSLISHAQISGGMIQRSTQKSSVTTESSKTTIKKKPSSSTSKTQAKHSASKRYKQGKSYTDPYPIEYADTIVGDMGGDIDPEQFYQWGLEDYNKNNYGEAKEWFELAVQTGNHVNAAFYLGCIYYDGMGVSANHAEAFRYFKISGFSNNCIAQWYVGYMLAEGSGVQKDERKADLWYHKALSNLFELAKDALEADDELALQFLLMASIPKNTPYEGPALSLLGYLYYYGKCGVKQDYYQAFDYFSRAENVGSLPAKYYLGLCYEFGHGVKESKSMAKKMYKASGYDNWSNAFYIMKNPVIPSSWTNMWISNYQLD